MRLLTMTLANSDLVSAPVVFSIDVLGKSRNASRIEYTSVALNVDSLVKFSAGAAFEAAETRDEGETATEEW